MTAVNPANAIVVQTGEGWTTVARRAGVTVQQLLVANGATSQTILHPGRILLVPEPVSPPPPPPPPPPPTSRYVQHGKGGDWPKRLVSAFGGANVNPKAATSPPLSIPRSMGRRYCEPWSIDYTYLGAWTKDFALPQADSQWKYAVDNKLRHPLDTRGPMFALSIPLSVAYRYVNGNQAQIGYPRVGTENAVLGLLGMADLLAGGTNGKYHASFANAATEVKNHRGHGYDDWPTRIVWTLGQENNGDWGTWYSGVDSYLIGRASLKAALPNYTGATRSLLEQVLFDGNRGPLFKAVFEKVASIIRNVDDRIITDCIWAYASAAPQDVPPSGSTNINPTSIPDPMYCDSYGYDPYWRGPGRPEYIGGSNPSTDTTPANWRHPMKPVLEAVRDIAHSRGRQVSFAECGFSLQKIGGPPYTACTDNQARVAYRWLMDEFLPTCDLAYWTHWAIGEGDRENYPGETHDPVLQKTTYPLYFAELAARWPATI